MTKTHVELLFKADLVKIEEEAKRLRATHIAQYCTRRIDHREGHFTQDQLAGWEKQAAERWDSEYPAIAALIEES